MSGNWQAPDGRWYPADQGPAGWRRGLDGIWYPPPPPTRHQQGRYSGQLDVGVLPRDELARWHERSRHVARTTVIGGFTVMIGSIGPWSDGSTAAAAAVSLGSEGAFVGLAGAGLIVLGIGARWFGNTARLIARVGGIGVAGYAATVMADVAHADTARAPSLTAIGIGLWLIAAGGLVAAANGVPSRP